MPLVFSEEAVKRLPAPIVEKLRSVIGRVRRVLWWRGLWLTFAAAVAALLMVMALDGAFDLESVMVRCALSLAGLLFVMGVAWKHLVQPLSRSVSLAAVARAVEFHHPEMQERISTAVELLGSDDPSSLRGSEELLDEVVKSAVTDVAGVRPETEFSSAPALWPRRLAVATLAALVLVLAIWPFHGGMLIARALLPFANIGSASAFDLRVITQDQTVPEGEPLTILVAARGRAAQRVDLHRGTDAATTTERLMPDVKAQVEKGETGFALHMPAALDSFRYHVTSRRARSREFGITVLKRPNITGLSVTYTPPAYTGLGPTSDPESTGDLIALSGTTIEVTARLARAAASAHLQYDQTENTGPPVAVGMDPEGKTPVARWSVTLEPGTDYRWTLQPKGEGDLLGKPFSGVLRSTEDLSPAVVIDSPLDRELDLRPNDVLPILFTAADDYGFSAVDLRVKVDGRGDQSVAVPMPTRDPAVDLTWHGAGTLELSKLALVGVEEVRVCVRVADGLPPGLHGPQVMQSEEILIRLNWGARSFAEQTVNKQEEQIRRELERIRHDLWDQRGEADEKARQLSRPDRMGAEQLRQLEALTERAAESADTLSATAAKMEKSAYAERAEAVEHAAKSLVKPAAESLEQIPQSDSPQQRSASAAAARQQLEAAAKSIDDVLASLQQDQGQAQEASELATLAEQQQQLADQAKAAARPPEADQQARASGKEPPQSPPLTPEQQAQALQKWQDQQEYVASEAGGLAGRFRKQSPPDKQSDLQTLARQAQSLAAEAHQLAAKQEGVEQGSARASQLPASAAEAAQAQANVAAESQDLAGEVEEFSRQAAGTLQQNGKAATNTQKAARALARASETGLEAVRALSQESTTSGPSTSDASDSSDKSDSSDGVSATPAEQAVAKTGESIEAAAAALQEAAEALAHQAEGIAAASQALASATQQTGQAATAGQQAREAGQQAGQQAAAQAAQNGQNPQQAQQQAANAAQEKALAQNAAEPAQQAANNLALAAATAQSAMGIPKDSLTSQNMGQHGSPKPGDGQPGQDQAAQGQQKSTKPGRNASDRAGLQTTKDYGLPPELAKLGMTIDDWSRLRGLVQSGAEGAASDRVPAEYRELVKGYFRALSAGSNAPR